MCSGMIGRSDIGKSRDRGTREFKSHIVKKEGDVMLIAERNVLTTHGMNSIKNVARLMKDHDFRRIPVTDAGTNRLEGIAVAIDILDFLGGGEKYNIITEDHRGNFLAAINCPIHKIMNKDPAFVDKRGLVENIVKIMMEKRTSAIPIVEDGDEKRVIGIVTERDVLPMAEKFGISIGNAMVKKCITSSLGMMIGDVSRIMVRNRLRRLPVIQEDKLIGIVTVFDVLKFLGYGEFRDTEPERVLETRVERIMEKDIIAVKADDDLAKVSNLVKETGLGGFPVVENETLVGIVTTSDVIRKVYGE